MSVPRGPRLRRGVRSSITPDFFPLLGMPIVRGRVFADGEVDAVLVSE